MRLSEYFLPVIKEEPKEAEIVSHRLMLRAGMVRQLAAGMYNWLPLGHRVLRKISQIVREEMDRAGCLEMLMPTLQPAELWQESGRYEDYGKEMLRIVDRHERPLLYGPTNEEVITDIFRKNVRSYKELPMNLYHIQWKFRDEIRPRFGVMRGREFLMKDAYSFAVDKAGAEAQYDQMFRAYLRVFRRMGLHAIPLRAETGAIGGNLSHEFHIVADTGESALFYDPAFEALAAEEEPDIEQMKALYAAADEQHDPAKAPKEIRERRGIEVGHIFYFGTKYSEALGATVMNAEGKEVPVEMGSYGVGISRLVGAIIEANHDEAGIIWPNSVAPFDVGLINLKAGDAECDAAAEKLYAALQQNEIDVLYDDRKESAGAKFATMDLIGLHQIALGPRGVKAGMVELKCRQTGKKEEVRYEDVVARILN